jgi:hypothetical protein
MSYAVLERHVRKTFLGCPQARASAVSFTVAYSVAALVAALYGPPLSLPEAFGIAATFITWALIQVHWTNCLVVGGCNITSWLFVLRTGVALAEGLLVAYAITCLARR